MVSNKISRRSDSKRSWATLTWQTSRGRGRQCWKASRRKLSQDSRKLANCLLTWGTCRICPWASLALLVLSKATSWQRLQWLSQNWRASDWRVTSITSRCSGFVTWLRTTTSPISIWNRCWLPKIFALWSQSSATWESSSWTSSRWARRPEFQTAHATKIRKKNISASRTWAYIAHTSIMNAWILSSRATEG